MGWWNKLVRDKKEKESITIDMMKDDTDPAEVNIENAYKTRWIWYHTILAIEIMFTNILLVAILVALLIKL
jgi:hypothetical protein